MDQLFIPYDVFLYITRYLDSVECMCFALSGISQRFIDFYCNRRVWNFSRSFNLKPDLFDRFLRNCIQPLSSVISTLDFSHCYWLPAQILIDCIKHTENLKELYIHDTQLTLTILPLVLRTCPALTHLSFSFGREETWEEFSQAIETIYTRNAADMWTIYTESFSRLVSLKLFLRNSAIPNFWLFLLRILGWCKCCTDLHLDCFYADDNEDDEHSLDHEEFDQASEKVIHVARKQFYPLLAWMSSLKNFVYIKRGRQNKQDYCFEDFCRYLFEELKPQTLECVWVPFNHNDFDCTYLLTSAKCLSLGHLPMQVPPSSTITQLGRVLFSSITSPLPNLRFIQGYCSSTVDFELFCQQHPRLEHLYLDCCELPSVSFNRHWALPQLKTLVYACDYPQHEFLSKLIKVCPNIQELHIGRLYRRNILLSDGPVDAAVMAQIARLERLKKLTLSGLEFTDGVFLQSIFSRCQQLRCLHVFAEVDDTQMNFHRDLCMYLPLATELRDVRLHWDYGCCSEEMLGDFLTAARSCRRLERLVFCLDGGTNDSREESSLLAQLLSDLVRSLPNLVVLCVVCRITLCVRDIKKQMMRKILPSRPWFWFHIGNSWPKGGDLKVPRVHHDEIITPLNYFHSPPQF